MCYAIDWSSVCVLRNTIFVNRKEIFLHSVRRECRKKNQMDRHKSRCENLDEKRFHSTFFGSVEPPYWSKKIQGPWRPFWKEGEEGEGWEKNRRSAKCGMNLSGQRKSSPPPTPQKRSTRPTICPTVSNQALIFPNTLKNPTDFFSLLYIVNFNKTLPSSFVPF